MPEQRDCGARAGDGEGALPDEQPESGAQESRVDNAIQQRRELRELRTIRALG
jgi:hypothetical protein